MNPSYILHLKFLISCTVIEKLNSEITPTKSNIRFQKVPSLHTTQWENNGNYIVNKGNPGDSPIKSQ